MTTTDLTAAVARLREQADLVGVGDIVSTVLARRTDLRLVLDALEAAQADARRYRWLRDEAPQKWAPWADERDALREVVRAADAMALECRRVGLISSTWLEDYDDARAKVKP